MYALPYLCMYSYGLPCPCMMLPCSVLHLLCYMYVTHMSYYAFLLYPASTTLRMRALHISVSYLTRILCVCIWTLSRSPSLYCLLCTNAYPCSLISFLCLCPCSCKITEQHNRDYFHKRMQSSQNCIRILQLFHKKMEADIMPGWTNKKRICEQ